MTRKDGAVDCEMPLCYLTRGDYFNGALHSTVHFRANRNIAKPLCCEVSVSINSYSEKQRTTFVPLLRNKALMWQVNRASEHCFENMN